MKTCDRLSLRWLALVLLLGIASPFRADAASCFSAPAGLVGWWPGEGSAANLAGTNQGTLQGGATASAAGMVGSAFGLDGTNAFVQVASSSVLQPTNLTIEAWVLFS